MSIQHDVGYFENSTYCTDSFQDMVENAYANGYTRLNAAQFKRQKQLEAAQKRTRKARTSSKDTQSLSKRSVDTISPETVAPVSLARSLAAQTGMLTVTPNHPEPPANLIQLSDAPDEDDLQVFSRIKGGALLQLSPGLGRVSRRRMKARTPKPLGNMWQKMVSRNGWQASLDEGYLRGHFAEIVGGPIASHCQIESIQDDTLILRCSSTAWAKALQMEQASLLKNIDAATGAITIKRLIILGPTAPSWKYGVKSVPGRGPRDTYG